MTTYEQFKRDLRLLVLFAVLTWFALNAFRVGFDSTDGRARSGLGLYTDALTGCQYLSARASGITPRLDRQGHHICGATP